MGINNLRQITFPARAQAPNMATKPSVAKKSAKSAPVAAVVSEDVVLPVSVPAGGGDGREEIGIVSVEQLLSTLKMASPEQCCALLMELHRGMPLYNERLGETVVVPPKKRGPRKAVAAATVTAAPLPDVAEGDAPAASEYRVSAADIDESVCVGRILKGGEDKRWSPIIYRERQCGGALEEGTDLCATCSRREEKYGEIGVKSGWAGRVTEEPFDETHMLGTAWADKKKPRFLGAASEGGDGADTASTASTEPKPKGKPGRKPMSPEEKAAKAAAKEAEKAAAKAAKEAEKAAAKAAKEAEKVAAKAAKPKAAPKAKKEAPAPAAAAAGAGTPAAVEGEMRFVDGSPCWLKGTNLYEYDDAAEVIKDYLGQYDGETLIPDGEDGGAEIVEEAEESDAE